MNASTMIRPTCLLGFILNLLLLLVLPDGIGTALAVDAQQQRRVLLLQCERYIQDHSTNPFNLPIYIKSQEQGNHLSGDIYGLIHSDFEVLVDQLGRPDHWTDIVFLHLNVKACTWQKRKDRHDIKVYIGRKFYQPPKKKSSMIFHFNIKHIKNTFYRVDVTTDKGPFFTKNHWIMVEAAPYKTGQTVVHFSYGYRQSRIFRLVVHSYLKTLGRKKNGFTVLKKDSHGNPVYIKGIRGMIERNAVRYYLAIQAFLDTYYDPLDQKLNNRLERWYNLTALYPDQLYEIEKEDYLSNKLKELEHHRDLQKEIDSAMCQGPINRVAALKTGSNKRTRPLSVAGDE